MATPTELEEAQLILAYKKLIISQAHALYAPHYPPGAHFSIILQERHFGCSAWLIVYTTPGSYTRYEVLKGTHSFLSSDAKAVGELWRRVKDWKGFGDGKGLSEGMVIGGAGEKEGEGEGDESTIGKAV
ncbi:hypothetical protein K458DRAFT_393305 [Lentithecium fluviatile CBS 122367]|uniref:Uncharacterized protein n=1 Tax=Lentithecium fluviatile CBS 122367 TaxID=1168545 RepID=A0A6G1IPX3_9PLEO|nr:hypothetical protein K458DRAFT_393305 [Lentithecium fluviatile CBS 122367]